VIIAMVLCLVAANRLVDILVWPLERAQQDHFATEKVAVFRIGDTVLWKLKGEEAAAWPGLPGTNRISFYNLVPRAPGWIQLRLGESSLDRMLRRTRRFHDFFEELHAAGAVHRGDPVGVVRRVGFGVALCALFYWTVRCSGHETVGAAVALSSSWTGTVLFLARVAFCYFIMVQIALNAAVLFSRWMTFGADEWRAEEYVSFVCKFMLGMGLAFELPVVILTLVKINLLDYRRLTKFRPYWS